MTASKYFTKKETNLHTIAFYNVENLFDTYDDPNTIDEAFLPDSDKKWTKSKYDKKIFKLGNALSNIGFEDTGKAPVIIGLAEVENRKVVADLINSKHLKNKDYAIVHNDSPDERGIDVAFIYQTKYFEYQSHESVSLYLEDEEGERDYTRDILWVQGLLNAEKIHVLVNHWPSRREGFEITNPKRIAAAEKNREIINQIKANEGDEAKIIIMGDFNDDPSSESIKDYLVKQDFYNPMQQLLTRRSGTTFFKGEWNLFDQIIFSNSFHRFEKGAHNFAYSKIFDPKFLTNYRGRYKGKPFRTYVGRKYQGGYSDHFPVYMILKQN